MPSAKSTASRPVPTLADATAKTRSLIEDLQARLTGEGGAEEPPRRAPRRETLIAKDVIAADVVAKEETEEELERQLQAYFDRVADTIPSTPAAQAATNPSTFDEIRTRAIDGAVERILTQWAQPDQGGASGAALRREVIERLIDRVLETLQKTALNSSS